LVSKVPEKGTVGASGDLAPLAHLIVGFLGIGELWNPKTNNWEDAKKVLEEFEFVNHFPIFIFFFCLIKFFFISNH
jgi:histidine ammonia-lyase